ncbi:YuiH family molybdopterin-binding domain protein [Natronomonas moolapensis 8.8.11]|uniref:YuiH family molybdopterin-binding domain protein n=1 Tax=Natronomonas moolapensis (strain DSM 18674 / CECT 7526 / JCM 14361 / 8.8.11) TaxID=268739 RepID=M1XQ47_NATM8|nr:molybdopterin-dependent oxidoreductase [Natronomonas moolapensis]CCQ36191.1 YuiH family molybdopterin-binding domain protein [Natronomonas moolapensis 8.8.11]
MKDVTDLHEEFDGDRLPPGQRETSSFPVLSKGETPSVPTDPALEVWGAVDEERSMRLGELRRLGAERQRQDFHCVTGWSRLGCVFEGLPFPTLADHVGARSEATHVLFHAHDGYTTDLPLSTCLREEVLLTWALDGEPIPADHGGPLRAVTPHKYAYKGSKWLSGVEFLTEREPGYWERRGYSGTANPWNEERYG